MTKSRFEILGEYFGYPKCCIDAFAPNGEIIYADERSKEVIDAARTMDGCGFIPCPACAAKVVSGQVTLKDLITNRKHDQEFPRDDWNTVDKYLNSLS